MLLRDYRMALFLIIFMTHSFTAFAEDVWIHWENGLDWYKKGKLLMEQGELHSAKNHLKLAQNEFNYFLKYPEQLGHMFGVAHFGRALVFEAKEQYESAIKEYYLAIKNDLHPTVKISSKAYMNMGTIHMRNINYEEAINIYLKAIELKPKNGLAHYFLGLAYFKSGDFGNAEKKANEAKELGVKYNALSDNLNAVKRSSPKKAKKE